MSYKTYVLHAYCLLLLTAVQCVLFADIKVTTDVESGVLIVHQIQDNSKSH